jgi:GNAT superfamily N-acetyltransferase
MQKWLPFWSELHLMIQHMTALHPEARRIEDLLLNATQPLDQLQYDGWLLRFSREDAKRARSVNPVYGSSRPLSEKIAHCENLYGDRGMPALFRLTPFAKPPGLDQALAQKGYERFDTSLVMSADLQSPLPEVRAGLHFERPHLGKWLDIAAVMRDISPQRKQAEYQRLFEGTLPGFAVIALLGDTPVACGLTMVEEDYAGLFAVCTLDEYRNQGIGTALCAHLMQTAGLHGAGRCWLSVVAHNVSALRVYEKLGFSPIYEYWYRARLSH